MQLTNRTRTSVRLGARTACDLERAGTEHTPGGDATMGWVLVVTSHGRRPTEVGHRGGRSTASFEAIKPLCGGRNVT